MAEPIQFGGTNGVSLLDMGQAGGALAYGSVLNMTLGQERATDDRSAMPQRDWIAVKRMGVRGLRIRIFGFLRADTNAHMNTLETNIRAMLNQVPTRLKNTFTGQQYENVILEDLIPLGRRDIDATDEVFQRVDMRLLDVAP